MAVAEAELHMPPSWSRDFVPVVVGRWEEMESRSVVPNPASVTADTPMAELFARQSTATTSPATSAGYHPPASPIASSGYHPSIARPTMSFYDVGWSPATGAADNVHKEQTFSKTGGAPSSANTYLLASPDGFTPIACFQPMSASSEGSIPELEPLEEDVALKAAEVQAHSTVIVCGIAGVSVKQKWPARRNRGQATDETEGIVETRAKPMFHKGRWAKVAENAVLESHVIAEGGRGIAGEASVDLVARPSTRGEGASQPKPLSLRRLKWERRPT